MKSHKQGFSLIELMIVVAIVGVISAIAYPSYVDSVRKGRRSEAISALLELAVAQERWRTNNSTYTNNIENFNYKNLNGQGDDGDTTSEKLTSGFYTVTASGASASAFTITAAVVAGKDQANDTCGNFVIDQNGPNYTNPNANRRCWNQ